MARSKGRQNEDRLREMREQALESQSTDGPAWKTPRIGEWWALAPSSAIHMISQVNDKLRVTYVRPLCGGRPSQARVEVPFSQLRDDPGMQDYLCDTCWADPRAFAISIARYAETTAFSQDEVEQALQNLESAA